MKKKIGFWRGIGLIKSINKGLVKAIVNNKLDVIETVKLVNVIANKLNISLDPRVEITIKLASILVDEVFDALEDGKITVDELVEIISSTLHEFNIDIV